MSGRTLCRTLRAASLIEKATPVSIRPPLVSEVVAEVGPDGVHLPVSIWPQAGGGSIDGSSAKHDKPNTSPSSMAPLSRLRVFIRFLLN